MSEKQDKLDGQDAQAVRRAEYWAHYARAIRNYEYPEGVLLASQLEWFLDQKFGLMVHWGLYNELGIKESWPLVGTMDWARWQFKDGMTVKEVKEMYEQLHRGFLPLRFDPKEWADLAYDAGFRYLCFTTKHHEGFCMWDTKTTDYKVTGKEVPWRDHKYADITKHLFDAFRDKGMGISLYYSRADFSCPYYWEPGYIDRESTQRIPSYDPDEKPDVWRKFQEFVYAQLKELCTDYGRIDALWFDGGCDGVKLGLPEMIERLRRIQPHMLSVIRGGKNVCEDIITLELAYPDKCIDVPWEVCTVMGKKFYEGEPISFGYTFDQDYMTAKEVAHLLLDTVAKGGNLALNISPQPDGRLPGRALRELAVLGAWMRIFGDAIYGTRSIAPYHEGRFAFTRTKDSLTVNAFLLYGEGEVREESYFLPIALDALSVTDLRTGAALSFAREADGLRVYLPESLVGKAGDIADCFRITVKNAEK